MIEHCLIYCCLGGKSLYKNYLSGKGEFVLAAKRNVLPRANVLNGTVCFSCNIGKAEEIRGKKFLPLSPYVEWETDSLDEYKLLRRACLNHKQMSDYQPKHALYLTNVEAIAPMPTTALGRRDPTHLNLAEGIASGMFRAPQNMCWAWAWNDEERKWERVLVLSLRPKNLCNIANGLKDIETRRVVVEEIKEMEK